MRRYDGFLGCDGSNSEIQPRRKCCSLGGHIALRRSKWFIRKETADNVEPDSLVGQTKKPDNLRLDAVSCLGCVKKEHNLYIKWVQFSKIPL